MNETKTTQQNIKEILLEKNLALDHIVLLIRRITVKKLGEQNENLKHKSYID